MTNTVTRTVTARLPRELVERIDEAAEADERSRNFIIRRAIERALDLDATEPRRLRDVEGDTR